VSQLSTSSSEESKIPTIEDKVKVSPTETVKPVEVAATFVN